MSGANAGDLLATPALRLQKSHSLLPTNALSNTGDATTAITLASADQAEMYYEEPRQASRTSEASESPLLGGQSSDEEMEPSQNEGMLLANMLHELMLNDVSRNGAVSTLGDFNVITEDKTPWNAQFLEEKVLPSKLCSLEQFRGKLKHFFILSTAGKPIYSLNGDDDVIMGYMGLITTIVGTFQESSGCDFKTMSQDGFKMVVMNKSPIILVAITKVAYELAPPIEPASVKCVLEEQLELLYNYILAVLSKLVITKNFNNGMNYDLRRILMPQDFQVLDILGMKLTYGFYQDEKTLIVDSTFYLRVLLNNALQCARITNTSRTKLCSIFLSVKKLKTAASDSEAPLKGLNKLTENTRLLAADLLFGFLTLKENVICQMRPRNHRLENMDIQTLLATVAASVKTHTQEEDADLWIPLCMPNFNSTGFLYSYVRQFKISAAQQGEPVTIILLSGNKNSFFEMKTSADYIIHKIRLSKSLPQKLASELAFTSNSLSILKELQAHVIKHFIFKRKDYNQVYMDDLKFGASDSDLDRLRALMHITYFYTLLANSKATVVRQHDTNPKKLTYTRWQLRDDWVTGFMLADEKYEFYCLCAGAASAQVVIDQSLKVISWCERYKKRLFVADGVSF